jgi:hypothetical protein
LDDVPGVLFFVKRRSTKQRSSKEKEVQEDKPENIHAR